MNRDDEDEVIDFGRTKVDRDGFLLIGKHKGETIEDVAQDDPTYVAWMLKELDLSDDEREDLESALDGRRRPRLRLVHSMTPPTARGPVGVRAPAIPPAPVKTGEVREAGSTMRVGDRVEIVQLLLPLFRIGSHARVLSVDERGNFVLIALAPDGAELGVKQSFGFGSAASVVVVERAKVPVPPLLVPVPTPVAPTIPSPSPVPVPVPVAGDIVELLESISPSFQEGKRACVSAIDESDFTLVTLREDGAGAVRVFERSKYLRALRIVDHSEDMKKAAQSVVQRAIEQATAEAPPGPVPIPIPAVPLPPTEQQGDFDLPALDLPPLDFAGPVSIAKPMTIEPGWQWTEEQKKALEEIADWAKGKGPRILSLTGFSGTGKTSLLREAIKSMIGVHLSAMTGKAALRLRTLTDRQTTTLHAVLYMPPEEQRGSGLEFASRRKPTMSTLIVDEASLIGPKIDLDLQEWAAGGVRVLLVGDHFQLPAVLSKDEEEIYGEDYSVFSKYTGPTLTQVMRASGAIPAATDYLRRNKRVQTVSDGGYHFARTKNPMQAAIRDYLADPDDHILITWTNASRLAACTAIRTKLGKTARLPERGEPVMIRQNQGMYLNGEIVIADHWEVGPTIGGENGIPGLSTMWLHTAEGDEVLTLPQGYGSWMDGGRCRIDDWSAWRRYCRDIEDRPLDSHEQPCPIPVPVTWGYASSCHLIQGSEFRSATTFLAETDSSSKHFRKPTKLPDGSTVPFSVRLLYTALSRARLRSALYVAG